MVFSNSIPDYSLTCYTPCSKVRHTNGNTVKYLDANHKLHRAIGPAVIEERKDGWHYRNLSHRFDGSAVTRRKYGMLIYIWCVQDVIHRLDGPRSSIRLEESTGFAIDSLSYNERSEPITSLSEMLEAHDEAARRR